MSETILFHNDTACRTLHASGMPKLLVRQVLNEVQKWNRCNGAEWTVARLKEIHLWWRHLRAGDSSFRPEWHKYNPKSNTPKGVYGRVFSFKNPAMANVVLSLHTAYKVPSPKVLKNQRKKFVESATQRILKESGMEAAECYFSVTNGKRGGRRRPLPQLHLALPGIEIVTGTSVPFRFSGPGSIRDKHAIADRMRVYFESWRTIPPQTVKFLASSPEGLKHLPLAIAQDLEYWRGSLDDFVAGGFAEYTGSIGLVQEPSLKARWIANPNRVTQHYLRPLGALWYKILGNLETDCTFDQDKGVRWAQRKLSEGYTLQSFDLSAATDRLDLQASVAILMNRVHRVDLLSSRDENLLDPASQSYFAHLEHFLDTSRGVWDGHKYGLGDVVWAQGQPLGTYPSFALLGLTHHCIALDAALASNLPVPEDSFRIVGDDIIMDKRMANAYVEFIQMIGGEINLTKSFESNQLGEFAGRLIGPDSLLRVNLKYLDPSDNAFMEYVNNLGNQAVGMLRPRQRKTWEEFKFVPGIAVEGGWSRDSHGESFESRYLWYLLHSGVLKEELARDDALISPSGFAQRMSQFVKEASFSYEDMRGRRLTQQAAWDRLPMSQTELWESPTPSLPDPLLWSPGSSDPRLVNGKKLLNRLERIMSDGNFVSYHDFKTSHSLDSHTSEGLASTGDTSLEPEKHLPGLGQDGGIEL
jgi:hypothetical protein